MKKQRPLWDRLYFDPVYVELARIVGYGGLAVPLIQERVQPLADRFGKQRVQAAADVILDLDKSTEPFTYRLQPEARRLCWQLLGPPPEHPDYAAYRESNPLPAEEPTPAPSPADKPKRARKKKGEQPA